MSDPRATARAIDALRRGWPVAIDEAITVLAIESADALRLSAFDPEAKADILISSSRAVTLKLANQRAAATLGEPVVVARTSWLDLAAATALADPATDLANPLMGPFAARDVDHPPACAAALELARHAGLLPAFFVLSGVQNAAESVSGEAVHDWDAPERLAIAARARLPVAASEKAELVAFRSPEMAGEHVALIIGQPDGEAPLVRLHSECLTGDVLGSLK